ncbi:hypothetical protein J4418_00240 [Candidatus Woesearchaeota archaeon]|nr:hypothetical protein [Candidatus Woesearchaeota archaeon]
MTMFIANLSSGKGTLGHVGRLMKEEDWDKVVLVTNPFGKENFKSDKPFEMIVIDERKPIKEFTEDIIKNLKDTIN